MAKFPLPCTILLDQEADIPILGVSYLVILPSNWGQLILSFDILNKKIRSDVILLHSTVLILDIAVRDS